MDVADHIVVIVNARVEQLGTQDELYERPDNDFVMLPRPRPRLTGDLVRPHDLEVVSHPQNGAVKGLFAMKRGVG